MSQENMLTGKYFKISFPIARKLCRNI